MCEVSSQLLIVDQCGMNDDTIEGIEGHSE